MILFDLSVESGGLHTKQNSRLLCNGKLTTSCKEVFQRSLLVYQWWSRWGVIFSPLLQKQLLLCILSSKFTWHQYLLPFIAIIISSYLHCDCNEKVVLLQTNKYLVVEWIKSVDNQSKVDNQVKFNDGIFHFIVIVN